MAIAPIDVVVEPRIVVGRVGRRRLLMLYVVVRAFAGRGFRIKAESMPEPLTVQPFDLVPAVPVFSASIASCNEQNPLTLPAEVVFGLAVSVANASPVIEKRHATQSAAARTAR